MQSMLKLKIGNDIFKNKVNIALPICKTWEKLFWKYILYNF